MILHSLSELILSVTSFAVFLIFFQKQLIYNRLLWGVFFVLISITALLTAARSLGWESISPILDSFRRLENTLGPLCMLIGTWLLISQLQATRFTFWATVGTGVGLYFALVWYRMEPLIQIIQPLCIVIALLLACWGLLQRQRTALWVVVAMTILALSSKLRLELGPSAIDPYHLLVAIATFCLGKAVASEGKRLFG